MIAGGSGVFGRLLAREVLDTTDVHVLVAGRDRARAAAACDALGARGRAEPVSLNLRDPSAVSGAVAGCFAVACAAGPFQELPRSLPRTALEAGAHWLDISDFSGWVLPLLEDRALDEQARGAGLAVMPGLSSVPTLSGVLARWCRERLPGATKARITLFVGNRNPKGVGAVASALRAPLDEPLTVDLPVGRRVAYRFDSPDAAILRDELGLEAEFRAAFEMRLAVPVMAAMRSVARWIGHQNAARLLSILGAPTSVFGTKGGGLQVEVWDPAGARVGAAFVGAGQRMAVLPCALALQALLSAELTTRGVVRPATWLPVDEWVRRLGERGLVLQPGDPG